MKFMINLNFNFMLTSYFYTNTYNLYNKEKTLFLKACQFKQLLTWPVSKIRILKCLPNIGMWGVLAHSQLSSQSLKAKISGSLLGTLQLESEYSGTGHDSGVGNGNPLQYSCLENPMDRGGWRAMAHSITKSRTQLK